MVVSSQRMTFFFVWLTLQYKSSNRILQDYIIDLKAVEVYFCHHMFAPVDLELPWLMD
jgi:hypothetical protein